ncbi:MAG TPA: hypothetical protein VGJ82_12475, partial [Thermoanaerobaculia bacterium]
MERRTKSKKRSAAKPPDLVFFVDRSMGRQIAVALSEAGVKTITHDSVFQEQDTPDDVWLARAGSEGWIVLTKDKLIRRRPLERQALIASGVRAFVFTGGNLSG